MIEFTLLKVVKRVNLGVGQNVVCLAVTGKSKLNSYLRGGVGRNRCNNLGVADFNIKDVALELNAKNVGDIEHILGELGLEGRIIYAVSRLDRLIGDEANGVYLDRSNRPAVSKLRTNELIVFSIGKCDAYVVVRGVFRIVNACNGDDAVRLQLKC